MRHFFVNFAEKKHTAMNDVPRYTVHHVPFLRLLLPLIAGIVLQHLIGSVYALCACAGVVVGCAVWYVVVRRNTLSLQYHYAFTSMLSAVVVLVGMIGYRCSVPQEVLPGMSDDAVAIARIDEIPQEGEYTYRVRATVVALHDSAGVNEVHIPVLLNMEKSHTASNLSGGKLILFVPRFQRITSSAMPYSYDYARAMAFKGVLFRQYLRADEWLLSSYETHKSLRNRAEVMRSQCVASLYESGLSSHNASLLAALLWGYRVDIPDVMRDYFSAAGLSHILAVSGLHTGIIAYLLWLLMYPLRYTPLRKMQHVATIAVLWFYAFITGLSPSVIRACVMATFVGVAHLMGRRNTTLNALCGSAVVVLLVSPMQLFDVGFQLSYIAVAGIVLLSPLCDLSRYIDRQNPLFRYLSGVIAVSVSAQIATVPVAAYYFHYIPVWGLLSNVVMVPLLPLPVVATLLLQLLQVLHIPHDRWAGMTDALTQLLVKGAGFISGLPAATIDGVWVTLPMLICYAVIIFAVWYMLSRRTIRYVVVPLVAVVVLLSMSLGATLRQSTPRAILSCERDVTTLQLSDERHNCYIISTDTCGQIPRSGKEWRSREQLVSRLLTPTDTVGIGDVYVALPFIEYYGNSVLWVDDDTWRYCSSRQRRKIDYAIITESYHGKIEHLLKSFIIKNVVLPQSIYHRRAASLRAECDAHGVACYDVRDENTPDIWCIDGKK